MTREERLNTLKEKLREMEIFEFRDELEEFLQEDKDQFTEELQDVISEELDGVPFPYDNFDDFLSDYQKNNPNDSAGYSDFRNRIYGGEE